MKFFLVASFVILCSASTVYRSRNISVNDDGNILITSPNGKRVVISRQIDANGQKDIDISISGPNIPTKTIQVSDNTLEDVEIAGGNLPFTSTDNFGEENRLKRGSLKSQGDILAEILREYQGVVTESQYEKLLNKINKAVKKGEISSQIYDLLGELDQQQQQQQQGTGVQGNLVVGQGVQYSQGQIQGQLYGSGYGWPNGASVVITPEGQSQLLLTTNQVPSSLYTLEGNRYWTATPNVNPMLIKLLPVSQTSSVNGLLAAKKLYGGVSRVNQVASQNILGTNTNLKYQQIPYGQGQIVSSLNDVPQVYGVQQTNGQLITVPQTIGQLSEIPQSIGQLSRVPQTIVLQQEQQIEQLNEVEQAIEQLNEVQQQLQQQLLQQQQRIGEPSEVQQTINVAEQLNEAQQIVGQLNQIQQQQQQQQQIGQIAQFQQPIGQINRIQPQPIVGQLDNLSQSTVRQLLGLQGLPIVLQQPATGQLGSVYQPTTQQLLGQQGQSILQQKPLFGQWNGLPQPIVQQLLKQQSQPFLQQLPEVGQLGSIYQPAEPQLLGQQGQLILQQQPVVGQLNGLPQPIVQQLWNQQSQPILQQLPVTGRLGGIYQPTVQQLLGQQGQLILQQQPVVGQLSGLPQPTVQQLLQQQLQPVLQQQSVTEQLSSLSQPIVQQLWGQRESILQRKPVIGQVSGLSQPAVQQLLSQQVQPIGQLQQASGQLKSVPLSFQKLLGIPQSIQLKGVNSYGQSIYGGYPTVQPVSLQRGSGIYLNTVPQVQVY